MDSISQIALGAAVGEVVLGKKVGNRAMLWGAIAGTIPDLDILANLVTDEISALAFHRAITHSIPFAIVTPLFMGKLLHRLYDKSGEDQGRSAFRQSMLVALGAFWAMIFLGTIFMPIPIFEVLKIGFAVTLGILFFPLFFRLRERYRKKPSKRGNASVRAWGWLLFWAIFTHPILDCFTTYGTQLLQPFLDYRVAWNTVSVADPVYTIPFLACVIVASSISRNHPRRTWVNWIGIGISTTYLMVGVVNKNKIDRIFEQSLKEQQISYERFQVAPTILNNILWQGIVESDSVYYHGMYSFLDKEPRVIEFKKIPKNHHLLDGIREERKIKILHWFSNGYYNVLPDEGDGLQLNDLRYGSMTSSF